MSKVLRAAIPAYAGVGGAAAGRPYRGVLGSRRHRLVFALLALLALGLPYAGLAVATVRAMVDPPATAIPLPELTLPIAQFPVRALPRDSRGAATRANAGSGASTTTGPRGYAPNSAGTTSRVASATPAAGGATRSAGPVTAAGRPTVKVPVVTSSYSAPASRPAKKRSAAQTAAGALAGALAAAPTVTNVAAPQPVIQSAPAAPTVPAPAPTSPGPLPSAGASAAASPSTGASQTPVISYAVRHGMSKTSGVAMTESSDVAQATTTAVAATASSSTQAASADATTSATAATSATQASSASSASSDANAAASDATTASTDASTTDPTTTTTGASPSDVTVAAPSQTTATASPSDAPDASTTPSDAAPTAADSPSTAGDPSSAPTAGSTSAGASTDSTPATGAAGAPSAATTPDAATNNDGMAPTQVAPATASVSGAPVSAPAGVSSSVATVEAPAATTVDTVSSPSEAAALTEPATEPAVLVAPSTGTTTVDLNLSDPSGSSASGPQTDLDTPAAAPTSTVTAISAADGDTVAPGSGLAPSAATAETSGPSGATGGSPGAAEEDATPSAADQTSLIDSDVTDTPATADVGGLGARGPPGSNGPQLISAARGGTIAAGAATLTFAPGSLPDDAYVTVSVTSGDEAGLGAVSAIYNLTAIDAATGAVIEHFGSAPVLSIAVGDDTGAGASIYYLPTNGAPQAINTTYDAGAHQVIAGLPHFSTYAVLFSIESVLEQYASNAITGDHTFTPGDLVVGGVVDIAAPSLTFDVTSVTGNGAGATFTATITVTAAGATISTAPLTAAFGAVSGSYVLANQTAGQGTLTLTLGGPSITVAGLASLSAATAELVSHDDGTTTTTTIGAANVAATVSAGAGGPAVSVTSPAFGLVASDPDAAGSAPAFALLATGSATLTGLPGISLSGTGWTVTYDALGDLSGAAAISVPTGSGTVSVDPAQPNGVTGAWSSFTDAGASPATLTIAGQTLSGLFTITAGGGQLTVVATDVGLTIGPSGSAYVTIPNSLTNPADPGANGELIVSSAGVAADLTVPSITLNVPSLGISSSLSGEIEVNTQAAPVNQTFTIGTTPTAVALPAGPFVAVSITVPTSSPVTLGPGQIAGTLLVEQQTTNGTTADIVGVSNASVWLASATSPVVTGGQGVFVIQGTGVAGYVSGTASVSAGTGFTGSGQVALSINTTGGAVDQTVVFGGQTMTISFGAQEGHAFSASVSGLSLAIGTYATVSGNVTLGTFTTTAADGSLSGQAFAGTGLTVFFGNGPAYLPDGVLNPLAQGVLITNATIAVFTATVNGTVQWAFSAQGTASLVGVPGVTLGGQVQVRVNSFGQGFTETLSLAGGGSVPLDFAPTEDASAGGAAFTSVGGAGLNVGVGGQTITADVTVSNPGGDILLGIANAQVSLSDGAGNVNSRGPPFAQLTQGTGALAITPAGIYGSVSGTVALNVPGVAFSGALSLLVNTTAAPQSIAVGQTTIPLLAGPYFEIGGSSVTLTIGSQSLTGTFELQQSTSGGVTTTDISATGVTLTLSAGGSTVLALGSGHGTLTVSSAGVSGSLSATVTTNALSSIFTLSSVAIAVNTTSAPAAGLPAGPIISAEADGARLTLAGQTLTGNFGFEAGRDTSGNALVAVVASGVNLALGSVGSLTDGSGVILVTAGDGVAASLTGTLNLNVPGITAAGTFAVQVNSTGSAVTQGFSVGGQTVQLSLPASTGAYVQVAATGATLSVLGQTLSGDITVTVTTGATPSVAIALKNGAISLGGGLAGVTGLTGSLTITQTDVNGALAGAVTVNATGVSLSAAAVSVTIDTATAAFSVSATNLTATIAGQTITGDFSLASATDASGHAEVLIAFSNPSSETEGPLLTLTAGGTTFATVAHGDGQLIISSAGVAGALEVSGVSLSGIPVTLNTTNATFQIRISTLPTAVSQAFAIGGGVTTLSLPAGPYVSLEVDDLGLTFGSATLQGSFAFSRQVAADGTAEIVVAASGVTVTAGPASLTQGQGALILQAGGVVGMLSGTAGVGDTSGGASVSGTVVLRFNSTTSTLDETITVGGQPVELRFGAGEVASGGTPFLALSVSSLSLQIGTFVTVQGAITASNGAFAGTGLTVFVGQGPAYLASGAINPLATGILISGAQIGLVFGATPGTYALVATGTATVLGASGITLTGTVTVTYNDTGAAVNQTIAIAGSTSPGVTVNLASGSQTTPLESAALTNGQISIAGQTLAGSFAFTPITGGVSIAASGVSLSLGSGLVSVSGGNGTFVVTSGGIAGSVSAQVTTTIAGVTINGGTDTVDVNTTTAPQSVTVAGQPTPVDLPAGPYVRVELDGVTVNLFGGTQTFQASLAIEATTLPGGGSAVSIAATNVNVTLGTAATGATISGGTGELLATSAGIAGSLSGLVTVALPTSVNLTGTIGLAINTTTSAVNQTFAVDGQTLTLTLPGGPYLELSGTGVTISAFGQTITGNVAIQQVTSTAQSPSTTVVEIAVSAGSMTIGGATPILSLTAVSGFLVIEPGTPTTVAGTLSGTAALNVPGRHAERDAVGDVQHRPQPGDRLSRRRRHPGDDQRGRGGAVSDHRDRHQPQHPRPDDHGRRHDHQRP